MKKPYNSSQLDRDLAELDTDIIWKNARNDHLKEKLETDLQKVSLKNRTHKVLAFPLRFCAVAAVIIIAFVLVTQEDFNGSDLSRGSDTEGIQTTEPPLQNKDVSVTFSREEQDLVEGENGHKGIFLTEEAGIPSTIILPSITGNPEIAGTKEQNRVLVSVTYPVKGGKKVSIATSINQKGSAKQTYDSLVQRYSGLISRLTIKNRGALLIQAVDTEGESRLILASNDFIYSISGGLSDHDLIKIAESIDFH